MRPDAGADPEQPEQQAQDRPHRRLPPRPPVVMDRVDRVLTSKIFVSRPLGVLTIIVRLARDDILPVIVPSNNSGSGFVGGSTRHVMQSTVLPGAAGVFAGIGSPVHHQEQPTWVT